MVAPMIQVPAIADDARQDALTYPAKIDAALVAIKSPDDAMKLLKAVDGVEEYLKQLKASKEIITPISLKRLQIMARLGELFPDGRKNLDRVSSTRQTKPYFSKQSLANYRKIHSCKDKLLSYYERVMQVEEAELTSKGFLDFVGRGGVIATAFGGNTEWYTPKKYIDLARDVMGDIDLDPASSEFAQRIVKAQTFYTAEDNGLDQTWFGRVFLNPPFKQPLISQFVNKLCDSVETQEVKQAILLTNNSTDTSWCVRATKLYSAICFTDHRIKFYDRAGIADKPTNGQMFFYFGNRTQRFQDVFKDVGWCVSPLFL